MKNKKGFVYIETIIVVVTMCTALLLIYSSFNNTIINEKSRLNYDDVSYIYKTAFVANYLNKYADLKFFAANNSNFVNSKLYTYNLGIETENLFIAENNKNYFLDIKSFYKIEQVILLDSKYKSEIATCTDNYIETCTDTETCTRCKTSFANYSFNLKKYIRTLNTNFAAPNSYVLIVVYKYVYNGKDVYNYASIGLGDILNVS